MKKIILLTGLCFCLLPLKGITKPNTIEANYNDSVTGLKNSWYYAEIDYTLDGIYQSRYRAQVFIQNNTVVSIKGIFNKWSGGTLKYKINSKGKITDARTTITIEEQNGGTAVYGIDIEP